MVNPTSSISTLFSPISFWQTYQRVKLKFSTKKAIPEYLGIVVKNDEDYFLTLESFLEKNNIDYTRFCEQIIQETNDYFQRDTSIDLDFTSIYQFIYHTKLKTIEKLKELLTKENIKDVQIGKEILNLIPEVNLVSPQDSKHHYYQKVIRGEIIHKHLLKYRDNPLVVKYHKLPDTISFYFDEKLSGKYPDPEQFYYHIYELSWKLKYQPVEWKLNSYSDAIKQDFDLILKVGLLIDGIKRFSEAPATKIKFYPTDELINVEDLESNYFYQFDKLMNLSVQDIDKALQFYVENYLKFIIGFVISTYNEQGEVNFGAKPWNAKLQFEHVNFDRFDLGRQLVQQMNKSDLSAIKKTFKQEFKQGAIEVWTRVKKLKIFSEWSDD